MKLLALLLLLTACAQDPVATSTPEVPAAVEEKVETAGVPESDTPVEATGGCWEQSCVSGDAHLVYLPAKNQYELRVKGKAEGTIELSSDGMTVEKISLLKLASQYVLIYQVHDGESAGGRVESFARKDLHKIWSQEIPGFNIGFAAKGNALYVSCIDFVGKIDLKKGKYAWRHSGFYKKFQYNGPDYIRVYDKEIKFISTVKTIVVEPKSGKLLP